MNITASIKKIAVIGCAGSGKTSLSLKLNEILKLPLIHLDKHYWKPHWQMPVFSEFNEIHYSLLAQSEWIMDGMYVRALIPRVDEADMIIFLDMPRYVCVWRILVRLAKNNGKVSASSAENCPERLDLSFLKFVWNFHKNFRRSIYQILDMYSHTKQIVILKSAKDVESFVKTIYEFR